LKIPTVVIRSRKSYKVKSPNMYSLVSCIHRQWWGQTQSAEVGVDDIDILGRLAEHEGPIAMSACIDERLNRSKKGQVKFALTGRSAISTSIIDRTSANGLPNLRNSQASHISSSLKTLLKKMKTKW
jgi:hypothetical protein